MWIICEWLFKTCLWYEWCFFIKLWVFIDFQCIERDLIIVVYLCTVLKFMLLLHFLTTGADSTEIFRAQCYRAVGKSLWWSWTICRITKRRLWQSQLYTHLLSRWAFGVTPTSSDLPGYTVIAKICCKWLSTCTNSVKPERKYTFLDNFFFNIEINIENTVFILLEALHLKEAPPPPFLTAMCPWQNNYLAPREGCEVLFSPCLCLSVRQIWWRSDVN